jgi:hypothetical protein
MRDRYNYAGTKVVPGLAASGGQGEAMIHAAVNSVT